MLEQLTSQWLQCQSVSLLCPVNLDVLSVIDSSECDESLGLEANRCGAHEVAMFKTIVARGVVSE